jgi:hypothetical protein
MPFGRYIVLIIIGQDGIRTHDLRMKIPRLKPGAFNHSATCPLQIRPEAFMYFYIESVYKSINKLII